MAVGDFNIGSNLDAHGNQLKKIRFEVLPAHPSSPFAGQVYKNSTDLNVYERNLSNDAWSTLGNSPLDVNVGLVQSFTEIQKRQGRKNISSQFDFVVQTVVTNNSGDLFALLYPGTDIEGHTIEEGDLVLVINQTTIPQENWIYRIGATFPTRVGTPKDLSNQIISVLNGDNKGNHYKFSVSYTASGEPDGLISQVYLLQNALSFGNLLFGMTGKSTPIDADLLGIYDSAAFTGKKLTFANLWSWVVSKLTASNYTTNSNTQVFTNKTFDANGAGNALSNVETTDFATGVIDTDVSLTADSDLKISTQKAVKAYVLGLIATVTASITAYASAVITFTNKTFDANGTGNVLTNVDMDNFIGGLIQTSISGASTNSQIPTALAVHSAINSAVVGLFDDRGSYNASGNAYPSTGGSGASGAILKGDIWTISGAGTIGGKAVVAGDTIRALVDSPGTTLGNWAFGEQNQEQATTSTLGLVQLASSAEADAKLDANKAIVSSALANYPLGKSTPFLIGNASATSFNLTHNFGKKIKSCKIRKVSDGSNWGDCGYDSSTSVYVVNFGAYVPSSNEFEVELVA